MLEIAGSTISNNVGLDLGNNGSTGGLGTSSSTADAVMTVTNSTFSGNSAGGIGAIWVGGNAHVEVVNSTVTNNTGTIGTVGGIFVADSGSLVTLYNTIVAGNHDQLWGGLHRDVARYLGSFDSASSNNLIGVVGWSGLSTTLNITGTETSPLDPGLALLDDYGGPTKTHALLDGSPAIDAGDNTLALAAGLYFDQRGGVDRIVDWDGDMDARVDIGAIELALNELYT